MPITTTGSITFQQGEYLAKMHLPRAASLDALRTFANALAAYTEAAIVEINFTQTEAITNVPSSGNCVLDMYALNTLHGETGKTRSVNVAVPAPKANLFETVAGEGIKVTTAKGNALAAAYSALTGETFTFVKGRLFGRPE